MGNEQSTLAKHGYVVEKTETNPDPDMPFAATKGDDKFLIRMIPSNPANEMSTCGKFNSETEILKIRHSHIVSSKDSFPDDEHKRYYIVTDYLEGGSLADKIKEMNKPPQESEVLSWIVEICMALKKIHEKDLLLRDLTPQNIHFTEFGILRLGGYQKIYENLKNPTTKTSPIEISYLPPEVYQEGKYNFKSEIWSVGCILYELCTQQPAFSANFQDQIICKLLTGPYPILPDQFSQELRDLLNDIFNKDPKSRPTTSEILECPLMMDCLKEKTTTSLDVVQTKVDALRALADGLEGVHQGTTVGSLTGGVIGAVGGITSIVGLILAPFTLGASLIVTGVGAGVGAVGGLTAGASNITNMVKKSNSRKAVQNIIKEIDEKIHAIVTWFQEYTDRQKHNSIQTLKNTQETPEGGNLNTENLAQLGSKAIKGLGGVTEIIRQVGMVSVGRIAEKASKVVRVAEVATGVLSTLFVAADLFFIAMDAKELHNISQAKAANEGTRLESGTETQNQSPSDNNSVKSEIMKFVLSIRQAADNLQEVLDQLKTIIISVTSTEDDMDLEWQDMYDQNQIYES